MQIVCEERSSPFTHRVLLAALCARLAENLKITGAWICGLQENEIRAIDPDEPQILIRTSGKTPPS